MSSYYRDSGQPTQSRMDEVAILFTVGVCTIGLASYLYLRAIALVTSLRFELNNCIGSLNELNENMNTLYIRAENFVTREDIDYPIEEGKYQAWEGTVDMNGASITIHVIHEAVSSQVSNEEWVANESLDDASNTVRDYYVDTLETDYDWQIQNNTAYLSERMVSTWTSVIRITISVRFNDGHTGTPDEYTKVMTDTRANIDASDYTWRRLLVLS